ncbi:tRNA (N6-threonylcarbamoyladenosine(37)-N6)-methyltransferase TrmO [Aliidiomarina halalkaliphila]|uniref:tRNA (N6-threonylcarbamoyladenosine(37)-N6)-methyltransferase TrmO n=1 Tax=Aliidiomarina halalkaliphila TaxID=2593535 RepID=A0A552X3A8_9GAMM|nr:tRNA (N6-threonylcarbamoyladenosine(37)-N6)-methyltransferase TrmO [Aliidiomarina halalkaliphila]TRW49497.1 tRNA (N6-threonylcarbamoyladenosine(37)-N6)-methyltransferase TrmO [Aliidiomarina halalkaliphila]
MSEHQNWTLHTIATVSSPYKQKFAIPRQPGLVKHAYGVIEMLPEFSHPDFLRGLEAFSHLWIQFVFHETAAKGWSPLVRPPRLGGNQRKGVFATRSTFRPNPMGLSVVELVRVEHGKSTRIHVRGLDLLDGTPVLDIKPYLPYADALPEAAGGFADERPDTGLGIVFSDDAEQFLQQQRDYPQLREFITEVLAQDPRPAYQKDAHMDKDYGMHLYHFNIKWRVQNNKNYVFSIE